MRLSSWTYFLRGLKYSKYDFPRMVSRSEPANPPLSSSKLFLRAAAYRPFALIYAFAILALLYHHTRRLLLSTSTSSSFVILSFLVADLFLAFMWATTESFRLFPLGRREYPENLEKVIRREDFPGVDVFICTADPYKEPPVGVVNTALSVMAYDYPPEKLSVYVSDDGGSEITFFAFAEAAKFARHWLPFCRENKIVERSPEDYFASNQDSGGDSRSYQTIKTMYESMRTKVENSLQRGKVPEDYYSDNEEACKALDQWTPAFTRQDHPSVIEVLLDKDRDQDITGFSMPNLVYVSREKNKSFHHHFKAGALNALVRVSAVMTNAPVILTLDCDMRSNDPGTLLRALCYVCEPDPDVRSKLGYIQFPQRYDGINEGDIYAGEFRRLFQINPMGMKDGPSYVGTGCFFLRRCLFGPPGAPVMPEIPVVGPDHMVVGSVRSKEVLASATRVSTCNYEENTNWGSKMGFRYGSLVEDYYTGYRLQCEGWQTVFCNPERAAFLGGVPITLFDVLNQQKRWTVGLQEVGYSKYSPITFGIRCMGLLMGLSYCFYAFWATWSVPVTIYSLLPQLALFSGVSVFPKVSEPWFALYIFLFVGAYLHDLSDFILSGHGATVRQWWNDQRMWSVRGLTCFLFGMVEFACKSLGISTQGFNITSKTQDEEQSKRYDQGIFDFGAVSPMFVTLGMVAVVNLISLAQGLGHYAAAALGKGSSTGDHAEAAEGLVLQILLAGFVVANCWPIYDAMFLRSDKGRLPVKVTAVSLVLASVLFTACTISRYN
ncbi:hypothetical protein MLD38_038603 [Melastoma candidum]|uniref:Uncharacterized protein n=1 Tax=Melastoma candidum TaxID=119954 RepID=A0ACB9L041_9MYRT|nr:hypothetical protein MLD38_038603 [Melastoma candidum]